MGNGGGSLRPEALEGTGSSPMYGTGHCKWFNVRMGFGFISMTNRGGAPIDPPVDVFVHQVSPPFNKIIKKMNLRELITLVGLCLGLV